MNNSNEMGYIGTGESSSETIKSYHYRLTKADIRVEDLKLAINGIYKSMRNIVFALDMSGNIMRRTNNFIFDFNRIKDNYMRDVDTVVNSKIAYKISFFGRDNSFNMFIDIEIPSDIDKPLNIILSNDKVFSDIAFSVNLKDPKNNPLLDYEKEKIIYNEIYRVAKLYYN